METTKPKNTKVQTFRDTATDGEWNKLIETALSTTPIGTRVQDDFGFSWSAIRNDAISRGYYEPKRRSSSTAPDPAHDTPIFHIADITDERDIPQRSTHSLFDSFNAAMNARMHNAALIPYPMTFFIFSFLFQKT